MTYNFNEIIPRKNTNSYKHDSWLEKNISKDSIPMWVADMDFKAPAPVTDALQGLVNHGVFGYAHVNEEYYNALNNWFEKRYNYPIKSPWLVTTTGIVVALAMAVKAYTNKGDSVMIQTPAYHPFKPTIEKNERKCITNSLINKNNQYYIDFEDFEKKILENNVKLFVLCSPHNPVMRVWSKEELNKIGEICKRYNCIVFSDEIHCDFVYPGHKHIVFSNAGKGFDQISLIATSPSKTFNIPSLQIANTFIPNEDLCKKFKSELYKAGYHQPGIMGILACQAAYNHGEDWLNQLMEYLQGNINFLENFLKENIPQVIMPPVEGTYLMWLDFRKLNMEHNDLANLITKKAKVWLSSGTDFGPEGEGFMRMNIGCPRSVLEEGSKRIKGFL